MRWWSWDPAGLFIYCTPEQAFWKLLLCVCVCVCVTCILACPRDHMHVLLMPKMGAPKVQYLDGLQCSPAGHGEGVRGWRSLMKQTRGADWQAWENLYRHHSVKGGWFICVLNFKNWSQVHIFIHYLESVWSREEVAFSCHGVLHGGLSAFLGHSFDCKNIKKKEKESFWLKGTELCLHSVCVCLSLPNLCFNWVQGCDSLIRLTVCVLCRQHQQGIFFTDSQTSRQMSYRLIIGVGEKPWVFLGGCVELSVLCRVGAAGAAVLLTRSLCPTISAVLLRSAPSVSERHKITGLLQQSLWCWINCSLDVGVS